MATLQDILIYLGKLSRVKGMRTLPVARNTRLRRLLRRRRPPIPYEIGPRGGYMVPYLVQDRHRSIVVRIECYPPTLVRQYWLPVSPELTLLEISAISMLCPTRLYSRVKTFRAYRKRGSKLIFDRDLFLTYDLPELDEDVAPIDGGPPRQKIPSQARLPYAGRAGRHTPSCDRKERWGPCPVPATKKKPPMPNGRPKPRAPKWTARPKTKRLPHAGVASPDVLPHEPQDPRDYGLCLPDRPSRTEAYLWRLAGGDQKRYEDLVAEYSDEITADRVAGRFEVKKVKK